MPLFHKHQDLLFIKYNLTLMFHLQYTHPFNKMKFNKFHSSWDVINTATDDNTISFIYLFDTRASVVDNNIITYSVQLFDTSKCSR